MKSGSFRGPPAVVAAAFVVVVLCCVGGGLLVWVAKGRGLQRDALGFASVQGRVREWSIEQRRLGRRARSVRYFPQIQYEYEVGGEQYEGGVISAWPPRFVTREDAEAWAAASVLEVGAGIEVWYDAGRPDRAVLMKDVDAEFEEQMRAGEIGAWVVLGIAGALGVVVVAVPGVRRRVLG